MRAGSTPRRRGCRTDAAALAAALANLEQAHVSTIHTFCADLLRERPVEACVDPRFAMLTDPQAQALFGGVFRDWLQARLEAPPPGVRRALRRRSYDDGPIGRLESAAWTLADWRDFTAPWASGGFDQVGRVDALIVEVMTFAALTAGCTDTQDALYQATEPARRLAGEVQLSEQVRPRDYDGVEAQLVNLDWWKFMNPPVGGRRTAPFAKGVTRQQVLDSHEALKARIVEFHRDADADLAARLHDELSTVIAAYEDAKARAGALDFLDLLVRARDVVRDRRDVRAAFQRRFTHLFVDEFQDTDPLQAEILLLLAADDPDVTDWRAVRPAPGKLFVVGDPKQSIYRFRRADVGIYEAVREQLRRHGAACVALRSSFRAVPEIQHAVNAAFAPRMTGDPVAVQAHYVPLAAVRPPQTGQPAVVALPVPKAKIWRGRPTKPSLVESQPDAVAAFIHWLVRDSGWTVTDRERPAERAPIQARDVCLLFRRFDTWTKEGTVDVTRPYVQALEARDLPHLLVGGKSFHEREEVETLRTALAAIEWPDDELSVFGTLRGALFAFGDDVLLDYRAHARHFRPFQPLELAPDAPEPLREVAAALTLLRDLHVRRNQRPVAATIASLLEASRAHAIFALRPSGDQALANVQYVGELARQYEAAGGLSFRGFVERLRDEAAETRAAEAPILEEGSDGVRLMTVHKAKGLEFPVVVLVDIGADLSRKTASRWVDTDGRRCAVTLAGWAPAELRQHEALEVARDEAEGVRVAYVAATRARDLLVVCATGDLPCPGWVEPLNAALYPAGGSPPGGEPRPVGRRLRQRHDARPRRHDPVHERAAGHPRLRGRRAVRGDLVGSGAAGSRSTAVVRPAPRGADRQGRRARRRGRRARRVPRLEGRPRGGGRARESAIAPRRDRPRPRRPARRICHHFEPSRRSIGRSIGTSTGRNIGSNTRKSIGRRSGRGDPAAGGDRRRRRPVRGARPRRARARAPGRPAGDGGGHRRAAGARPGCGARGDRRGGARRERCTGPRRLRAAARRRQPGGAAARGAGRLGRAHRRHRRGRRRRRLRDRRRLGGRRFQDRRRPRRGAGRLPRPGPALRPRHRHRHRPARLRHPPAAVGLAAGLSRPAAGPRSWTCGLQFATLGAPRRLTRGRRALLRHPPASLARQSPSGRPDRPTGIRREPCTLCGGLLRNKQADGDFDAGPIRGRDRTSGLRRRG